MESRDAAETPAYLLYHGSIYAYASFFHIETFTLSYSVSRSSLQLQLLIILSTLLNIPGDMPSKPKAPEIAAEAKKVYIPYIKQNYPHWDTTSYLIADSGSQMLCQPALEPLRCRIGTWTFISFQIQMGTYMSKQ
jgi:hypothetical protein